LPFLFLSRRVIFFSSSAISMRGLFGCLIADGEFLRSLFSYGDGGGVVIAVCCFLPLQLFWRQGVSLL